MTREDINRINSQYLNDCENMWEMEEIFALAMQALEQEPFINKPCISEKVCEHDKQKILDKIRAEIRHFMYDINPSSSESDYACNYILDILDKYKEESED